MPKQPAAKKAPARKPTAKKSAAKKPAAKKAAVKKPAARKTAAKPAAKKAAAKKPAARKTAAKPAAKKAAVKKPAAKKTAAKPAAKKAAAKPAAKKAAAKPAAKKAAAKPAAKKAAAKPAAKKAAAKPAAKKAAAKPAAKKAAAKPAAKKAAAKQPAARKRPATALDITLDQARAFWCAKQGLAPHIDAPLVRVVEHTGWVRTLGGVDVYLALRARCPGMRRAALDAAVAAGELHVLPAARGCIYLVPERDLALALSFAASLSRPRTERDLEKVGLGWNELEALTQAVLDALAGGALTTTALRKALPEGAMRSLGDAGKKLGMSSPLPMVLRELEFDGRIERTLEDGRLDTERYLWRIAPAARRAELQTVPEDPVERLAGVTRRFLAMAGPASIKELASWSGAGQRECAAAVELVQAVPVNIAGLSDPAWVLDSDVDALAAAWPAAAAHFSFLSVGDNLVVVHGGPALFVDPAYHDRPVQTWGGRERVARLAEARHLGHRMLLLGDRIVGFWEYDPASAEVMCHTFEPLPNDLGKRLIDESEAVAAFLTHDVGHGRSFSLDTDEALHQRAQSLRAEALRAQAERDRE
jgi:hypothetical protein